MDYYLYLIIIPFLALSNGHNNGNYNYHGEYYPAGITHSPLHQSTSENFNWKHFFQERQANKTKPSHMNKYLTVQEKSVKSIPTLIQNIFIYNLMIHDYSKASITREENRRIYSNGKSNTIASSYPSMYHKMQPRTISSSDRKIVEPEKCKKTPKDKHCLIEYSVRDRWPHKVRYVYNWYMKNCFEIRWSDNCPAVPVPTTENNFPTEEECIAECGGWA